MITLRTERQHLNTVVKHFLPYLSLLPATRLKNVEHLDPDDQEKLLVIASNCLILEVIDLLEKKNNYNARYAYLLTFKITEAQALTLYKELLPLPLTADHFYFNNIRNHWIDQLRESLQDAGIIGCIQVRSAAKVWNDDDFDLEE